MRLRTSIKYILFATMLLLALLIGFLIAYNIWYPGPGNPKTVTVEKSVPGPERTVTKEKTVPGPERTVEKTVEKTVKEPCVLPDTGGRDR